MRLLLVALFTALIVILAPGAANAKTCGVPQAKAVHETPEVQIYRGKDQLLGCLRATGRVSSVGRQYADGMGTYEDTSVVAVLGHRWVWTVIDATAVESDDHREHWLTDLRTGKRVVVETDGEDVPRREVVGLAGALGVAGPDGVLALHTGGRVDHLGGTPDAFGLAGTGNRVYWQDTPGAAQTATVALPTPGAARTPPRARTIGRCKPRPGARLLEHDGDWVITRAGGKTWQCHRGRTTPVAPDPVADPARTDLARGDGFTYWLDPAGVPQVAKSAD